ncbi:hypothetical protein J2T13_003767 [Paenibacillus sp. DS2015]|uniref:PDZ domain-containing protein n=1 Tax=Paenibacillus sp. DS2015 TaxID=3373917 RepID=UPI003D205094
MSVALEMLWKVTDGWLQLLIQPFYYISILFVMLFYRRQVGLERKMFHVRMHSWGLQTWRTVIGGLAGAVGVSLVMAFVGINLTQAGVICIWVVSLLLVLLRVRYLCFAYSAGLLGIVQFIIHFFPSWEPIGWLGLSVDTVRSLDIPALLTLAAILHLAEAILVKVQGASLASPLYIESKRGKIVGGYEMRAFWPLPLFLLIPAQTSGSVLPWTPLLGGEGWSGGFSLMVLPIVIGFGEMTQSMLTREKASVTSKRLILYSVILLTLSLLSAWWSPLMIVAALASILLHEALSWFSRYQEQQRNSLFVHPPQGLRVLFIVADSPAQDLGILPGETILKVNGVVLRTTEQLHTALRMNSAFCKIEVQNLAGQSKYLQRAIYAGDHHQLGVILAPDQALTTVASLRPVSIYQIIGMKLNTRRRSDPVEYNPPPLVEPKKERESTFKL